MHPCLQLREVLDVILEYIPENSSLAHLARVCKAFTEPVLDVLYAEMGFDTLLMSVDPKLCGWEFRMVHLDIGSDVDRGAGPRGAIDVWRQTLEFKRELTSHDWDTLLSYAARVKRLAYPCPARKAGRVSSNIGRALSRCPIPCLFPKLNKLQVLLHDDVVTSLPLFSGPLLRDLVVEDELENISSGSVIRRIASACPLVDSFSYSEIHRKLRASSISTTFPNVLSQWSRLKSLDCKLLDKQTIECLPRLSNLRVLRLYLNPDYSWLREGTQSYLRSLDELHIRADSYRTCARVIPLLFSQRQFLCSSYAPTVPISAIPPHSDPPDLTLPRVRSLHITITPTFSVLAQYKSQDTSPSHLSLTPLSDALAEFISPDALTHLHIENKSAYVSYSRLFDEPRGLERLASAFGRIESMELVLSPRAALDMSAERVLAVLSAWPCLERVHLRLRAALGLADLKHVLGTCPRMEWMDANVVMRGDDVRDGGGGGLPVVAANLNSVSDAPLTHVWMDWEADGLEQPSQRMPSELVVPTAHVLRGLMPRVRCIGHRYEESGRIRYGSLEDFEDRIQKHGNLVSFPLSSCSASPWYAVLEELGSLQF